MQNTTEDIYSTVVVLPHTTNILHVPPLRFLNYLDNFLFIGSPYGTTRSRIGGQYTGYMSVKVMQRASYDIVLIF